MHGDAERTDGRHAHSRRHPANNRRKNMDIVGATVAWIIDRTSKSFLPSMDHDAGLTTAVKFQSTRWLSAAEQIGWRSIEPFPECLIYDNQLPSEQNWMSQQSLIIEIDQLPMRDLHTHTKSRFLQHHNAYVYQNNLWWSHLVDTLFGDIMA